jgi:hypothetical protein
MVKPHIKLLDFSWDQEFKILNGGSFPVILGLDFMRRSRMQVDVAARTFRFGFAPETGGVFSIDGEESGAVEFLRLVTQARQISSLSAMGPPEFTIESLLGQFPTLFTSNVGTAKCAPYEIKLADANPVRSPPYRCAPPKLEIFREMVDSLLKQGVVRPSKSPYASPAFLVAKSWGGFRLVVDYRKVNSKIVFNSYPMPIIEQAFGQFAGARIFSVLDLNSAYFHIPLSARSRRITAFCSPFGQFEFNKLPVGSSVGSQGLSRLIDELFADPKGRYVFNFLDDLVVYSASEDEHVVHVPEVLGRLQKAGFTLNPEKVTFGTREIKYLGHLISSRAIKILPD